MYDYPQAKEPQPQSPAQRIVMELFGNCAPHEVISILKECEALVVERLSNESEELQHVAGQKRKTLEEARLAFHMQVPVTKNPSY